MRLLKKGAGCLDWVAGANGQTINTEQPLQSAISCKDANVYPFSATKSHLAVYTWVVLPPQPTQNTHCAGFSLLAAKLLANLWFLPLAGRSVQCRGRKIWFARSI